MSGRTDSESIEVAVNLASAVACETAAQRLDAVQPIRDFALALEWRSSGTVVLVLAGELDLYRAPEIERALAGAIGAEPHSDRRKPVSDGSSADGGEIRGGQVRRVAVDLRSVTFIDSTGLALLLGVNEMSQDGGFELSIISTDGDAPSKIFRMTGTDKILPLVDEPPDF